MYLNPLINTRLLFFFTVGFWKPHTVDNRGRYQVEILRNSAPTRSCRMKLEWSKGEGGNHDTKKSCHMNVPPLKQLPSEASSSFFILYTQSQWSFGRWFGHSQSWPQKKVWPNKLLKNCPATTDHGHAKTYAHLWNSKLGICFIFLWHAIEPWWFQFEYSILRV